MNYFAVPGLKIVIANKPGQREEAVEQLWEVVSRYFEIDLERLTIKTRNRAVVDARGVICYFMREWGYTCVEIARSLNQDHTTVVHNGKKVADMIATHDLQITGCIEYVKEKIFLARCG